MSIKLNTITEPRTHHNSITKDLFQQLCGKKWCPKDMHNTAFVTPDGQYEFMGMPFGMVNSEATCTLVRGLRKVLEGQSGGKVGRW